ncbi:MAG: DUF4294 domain-containing protein [Chitinophagales bacterium]|nr:DUF4294 domain-containing protein [Chitinophagales bacterium]
MNRAILLSIIISASTVAVAQGKIKMKQNTSATDTVKYLSNTDATDTLPTVDLNTVQIVSFKTQEEWDMYYKYKSRIIKVMPYVKIAKQLYNELSAEKDNSKKREYRKYRKDVEKEMRAKFENELKNLNKGQGEMLFKLINRETGDNCYYIIKEIKGGFNAWAMQVLAKKWGYDLKEKYNFKNEKMIELIIQELGPAYNVKG